MVRRTAVYSTGGRRSRAQRESVKQTNFRRRILAAVAKAERVQKQRARARRFRIVTGAAKAERIGRVWRQLA
jgi:hypothetical protein